MKEFITAIEDLAEDESGKVPMLDENDQEMRDNEGNVLLDFPHARFMVDGRMLRAYPPHEGQLTFMMANMGRGQTDDSRFAAIVNIMINSLREDDQDYFESRLLTRDRTQRLSMKTVEGMFKYLMEEWFARPTQPSSDSAESPPSDGEN